MHRCAHGMHRCVHIAMFSGLQVDGSSGGMRTSQPEPGGNTADGDFAGHSGGSSANGSPSRRGKRMLPSSDARPSVQDGDEVTGLSQTSATNAAARQVVLTPTDAAKQLTRLWEKEGAVLKQVFPELSAQSFFQQVVPVPPNRFRPAAKVGDQIFEHPQNVWLGKIITLNDQLLQLSRGPAQGGQDADDVGHAALGAAGGQVNRDRILRLWDEISHVVACISDSSRGRSRCESFGPFASPHFFVCVSRI